MFPARPLALILCGVLLLTGCGGTTGASAQAIEPSPVADGTRPPVAAGPQHPQGPAAATPDADLSDGAGAGAGESYNPADDSAATDTAVGQKVVELRADLTQLDGAVRGQAADLQQLRASTQTNAADYFNSVAAIDARLQVGTTTGNPILLAQWNQAEAKLDSLSNDVGSLNALSNKIANSASQAAYILESVRATFGLSGAVDEDHVHLAALEDDVNRTVVLIDRLLNEISGDLNRQSAYVSAERRNLQTLSLAINNGELYGQSLANKPYMSGVAAGDVSARGGPPRDSGRPLVIIRFDKPNVNYQHAVYQAVGQALDRYPQAAFDVMAVSPNGANAAEGALAAEDAKRNADGVARTMSEMGLPSGRIRMSASSSASASVPEVRIYVH